MPSVKLTKYLLIFAGVLITSLAMVKSGLASPYGMGFWGANGHDGIWHISLINSLSQGSLSMPIFAGENIKNYHLGFDLLVAGIHVLSGIPVINLYFHILPPIFALALGWLTYELAYLWKKSGSLSLWAVFFVFFGGSLGWIFGQGESLFWAQQSSSFLINPPYALSLIVLTAGLVFLQQNRTVPAILMFAILPQIKIYAGILAFAGLFVSAFKQGRFFQVLWFSLSLALLLYLPLNSFSAGLILFRPFWFLDTLFLPGRLDWPWFFSALSTFKFGQIWYKAIPAYAFALVIFLLGNLSLRLVGFIPFLKFRRFGWFEWFAAAIIVLGIIIPMLFVQKGTSWNTIQFFYYSQIFLGLFAAWLIDRVLQAKSKTAKLVISLCIIGFTLPTARETLNHYLPDRPPAKISREELDALKFLSGQSPGVVLTQLFSKDAANTAQSSPPRPLYLYESTAYVSAFSAQPVFLEDEVNLAITDYNWTERKLSVAQFFASPNREFLDTHHIQYIYLVGWQRQPLPDNIPGLKKIFSNSETDIYQVYKI